MPASKKRRRKPDASQRNRNRKKDERAGNRLGFFQTPDGRVMIAGNRKHHKTREDALAASAELPPYTGRQGVDDIPVHDADWRRRLAQAQRRYRHDGDAKHFADVLPDGEVPIQHYPGRRPFIPA